MEEKLDMEHRLTEVEARSKSNAHRLDDVEKRQDNLDKLTTSVSLLAEREERMESDVKEIKSDVKTLAEKPAKRWESVVEKALLAVVAAVVAYFLGRMGRGAASWGARRGARQRAKWPGGWCMSASAF